MTARPFDELAATYDAAFTNSTIGQLFRDAVWRRIDERFGPGDRILELNCGTGADAVHLAKRGVRVTATDAAQAMLDATRQKVATLGLDPAIAVVPLDLNAMARGQVPAPVVAGKPFDGLLSDFGGLNCVDDLPALAPVIGGLLRPGAWAVVCVMGPWVPWEWAWYTLRGQPAKAFRRARRRGAPWRGITVRYPTIRSVRRAFSSEFRVCRVAALGALTPPPFAEPWAVRHPNATRLLNRLERRLETVPPLPHLADHYLMELIRS